MIRIRTRFGDTSQVFTLYFMGKWVTLIRIDNKSSSVDAVNLQDAGFNHLAACHKVKEAHGQRGRLTEQLLHGTGHQGPDSHRVSDSDARPDREGLDGDDRSERQKDVQADSDPEENQDTFAF